MVVWQRYRFVATTPRKTWCGTTPARLPSCQQGEAGIPAPQAVVRRYFFTETSQRTAAWACSLAVLAWGPSHFDSAFAMTRSVGDAFLTACLPIIERRRDTPMRKARGKAWRTLR